MARPRHCCRELAPRGTNKLLLLHCRAQDGLSDTLLDLFVFCSHYYCSTLHLLGKEGGLPREKCERCKPGKELSAQSDDQPLFWWSALVHCAKISATADFLLHKKC